MFHIVYFTPLADGTEKLGALRKKANQLAPLARKKFAFLLRAMNLDRTVESNVTVPMLSKKEENKCS